MADSKRQSLASRVATPKVGPSKDVIDGDSMLYKAVGARIRVTCAPSNNTLEGTLFTACNITNAIAINCAPAPPNPSAPLASQPGDYHIIPFAHITSFELLGPGERASPDSGTGFESALPSIGRVDTNALRAREEQTIRELKRKEAMRGKGVTPEAQEVFDFISKRIPTRWDKTRIIINDAVVLEAPYGLDNVKAGKGGEGSLPFVRKTLEQYYAKKAAGGAPRKGG
ncbi:uncharacterized protein EI97DRAFT_453249 [Westerdykella ornata]|uniref:AD domain-containing protein n=1 Tax=Westerdykella ornata TaxID=318751 RepID=A0A6A6J7G1_WESOR|nr:uncharacterized protein EI97DRAFT_453249 [Westerdykella ornata]KAF2272137.1 hypothetical protein EI97DRAFT_453249 [Westerdykella ornata]